MGKIEIDDNGTVVGAHGLTLLPTRHTLTIGNAELYTWCALDAIGIPAAAAEDARVVTTCGWCEQTLTITVVAGTPADDGAGVVLWLPIEPYDNLREQFCPARQPVLYTGACPAMARPGRPTRWAHPHARRHRRARSAELASRHPTLGSRHRGHRCTTTESGQRREEAESARCSCCGEVRDRLVALLCHDDIKVCSVCIGWLRSRSGTLDVTPILPVIDMSTSITFYESGGLHCARVRAGRRLHLRQLRRRERVRPRPRGAPARPLHQQRRLLRHRPGRRRVAQPSHGLGATRHAAGGSALGDARVHPHRPQRQPPAHRTAGVTAGHRRHAPSAWAAAAILLSPSVVSWPTMRTKLGCCRPETRNVHR